MGESWGVLAAVLSSGLGGTSIGATRYLVNAIDPLAIGSFRFGIGFVLLLPVALLQGARWPARRGLARGGRSGHAVSLRLFPLLFNASLIFTTAARGALALVDASAADHGGRRGARQRSADGAQVARGRDRDARRCARAAVGPDLGASRAPGAAIF